MRRRRPMPLTKVADVFRSIKEREDRAAQKGRRTEAALRAIETRRQKGNLGGKQRQKPATNEKEIRERIEKAKGKQADHMRKLKLATNRVTYWQGVERRYRKRLEELLVKERDLAAKVDKIDRYIELEDTSD